MIGSKGLSPDKNHHWIGFWILVYIPLLWVGAQFWGSSLYQWDMVGHHLASLQFAREIWPDFVGWNPNHFGGFPQGYFYPSLFHWLIGFTQKWMDPEIAFRFWVVMSTLALPWSVDRLGATLYGDSKTKRAGMVACFMFLYFLPKGPAGGDLYSTFRIGLVNQNWALIPFFLYLSEYWRVPTTTTRGIRAGFWLGITLLSHAIVGFIGLMLLCVRWERKKTPVVLAIAAAVSAAWSVPFLLHREFATGLGIRFYAGLNLIADSDVAKPLLGLGGALVAGLILWGRRAYSKSDPWVQAALLCSVFLACVEAVYVFRWLDLQHFLAIHFYRFQGLLALFWLAPAFVACFESRKSRLKTGMLTLMVAIGWYSSYRCVSSTRTEFNLGSGFTGQSRVLVYQGLNSLLALAAPHHLADSLQAQGVKTVNGLFAESSRQSRFYLSTLNELFTKPMVWGVELMPYSPRLAKKHIRILGVDGIISNEPIHPRLKHALPIEVAEEGVRAEARFASDTQWETFNAYLLKNQLVEVLDRPRLISSADWKTSIYDWWMDAQEEPWLIRAERGLHPALNSSAESVEPKWSRVSGSEIQIRFDSPEPRWLLVKESYFPNWKATDDSGANLVVAEAAPSLLAVFGKGNIKLTFALSTAERVAQFLTWSLLGGFALVGAFALAKKGLKTRKAGPVLGLLGVLGAGAGCTPGDPTRELDMDRFISGDYHACKQKAGAVSCWGINQDGQLGTGNVQSAPYATLVKSWPEGLLGGAGGLSFTCMHTSTEVFCSGRLGRSRSLRPVSVHAGADEISGLVAKHRAMCILFKNPALRPRCLGALADHSVEDLELPRGVTHLTLGTDRLCYVAGLSVRCLSRQGVEKKIPLVLARASRIFGLAAGSDQVCALIESRGQQKLQCHGQSESFEVLSPDDPWKNVLSGDGHACALTRSGEVWCWGDNSKLQSDPVSRATRVEVIETPRKIPQVKGVKGLSLGAMHTCLLVGGYYSCFGALGNGVRGL